MRDLGLPSLLTHASSILFLALDSLDRDAAFMIGLGVVTPGFLLDASFRDRWDGVSVPAEVGVIAAELTDRLRRGRGQIVAARYGTFPAKAANAFGV